MHLHCIAELCWGQGDRVGRPRLHHKLHPIPYIIGCNLGCNQKGERELSPPIADRYHDDLTVKRCRVRWVAAGTQTTHRDTQPQPHTDTCTHTCAHTHTHSNRDQQVIDLAQPQTRLYVSMDQCVCISVCLCVPHILSRPASHCNHLHTVSLGPDGWPVSSWFLL